jgi:phospholipid/cholesterol/gamma-HCH transport system substrate-binding protein
MSNVRMSKRFHSRDERSHRLAGVVLLVILAVGGMLLHRQFRGEFTPTTRLTVVSLRSGLAMESGAKVTFNGVEIGRVGAIHEVNVDGQSTASLTADVDSKFIELIPANVVADIKATTLFGNKYVAFSSPKAPTPERITSADVIDVSSVSTEVNTLFETVTAISEQVDPVKLNQTLTATAQALDGLGDRFGRSLVHGNDILAELNPQQRQLRYDVQRFADLADVYADASSQLWAGLENAVITARTLNGQQGNLDAALMAAIGFGNTGGDIFEHAGPYLVRGAADLVPTSQLQDEYSPELFCTIRNYHDVEPKIAADFGGNGYSARTLTEIVGVGNPYVYPDNLPRTNAKGGPEGRPGCWQPITRELWPVPYLVMDTGASIAPYNHAELGQPIFTDYVWGRQLGEHTINP